MSLDPNHLKKLLQRGNTQKQIVEFFEGASETERKALAPLCIEAQKAELKKLRGSWSGSARLTSITYACYCASTFKQADKGWRTHIHGNLVYRLLADRRPTWIDQWAEKCCQQLRLLNYPEVRRLIREGLCKKPSIDNYIRMMIAGLNRNKTSILNQLKKDPDLLIEDIWRIFEVPGIIHQESLTGYLNPAWIEALVALSRSKSKKLNLDRRRLFERIFSATNMGFNRAQVAVFLDLHDALQPTIKERQQMFDSYCGLLDNPMPPVVKFGFETLHTLDHQKQQEERELCEALRSAMRSPTKSLIMSTLKWLGELINRNERCKESALLAATEGLLHEKANVQTSVWKFIQKSDFHSERLQDEVSRLAPTTSASVRKLISSWLKLHADAVDKAELAPQMDNSDTSLDAAISAARKVSKPLATLIGLPKLVEASKSGNRFLPACEFDGMDLARLENRESYSAIKDLDELVAVAAQVIENGTLVIQAERVVEALTRFDGSHKNTLAKMDPVLKRCQKITRRVNTFSPFMAAGLNHDIVPVLLAWANLHESTRESWNEYAIAIEHPEHRPPGWGCVTSLRFKRIMQRFIDGLPVAIVGTPSHDGFWIDPQTMARRLKKIKNPEHMLGIDQVFGLLRLAPDNRKKALKAAADLDSEFSAAFRYACGENTRKIGKTHYLWITAARARSPHADDKWVEKKFPNLGPDAGRAARYSVTAKIVKTKWGPTTHTNFYGKDSVKPRFDHQGYRENPNADLMVPTVVIHEDGWHSNQLLDTKPLDESIVRVIQSVWPQSRESIYTVISGGVDLTPLFDSSCPLLEVSSWALLSALAGEFPAERIQAIDLAIQTIADGRWDSRKLGKMLGGNLQFSNRYSKTLEEVAGNSPLHSFQIQQTLVSMLASQPKDLPSSFGGLLELLFELLVENQICIQQPNALSFLKGFQGGSKMAKFARKISNFTLEQPGNLSSIYAAAITGRVNCHRKICK